MNKVDVSPPSGTRDFLPEAVEARERVLAIIKRTFERHGFRPMETPAFERIEVLTGKYGDEGEKLIFKILKRGEKAAGGEADLALRYDLTVPLARVVARNQEQLGKMFRRYQIGPVWRADRPAKGRFREFYQCDFDIIGPKSLTADAEVLLMLTSALAALEIGDFVVRLNSRKVLHGLMEVYGVTPEQQGTVMTALDKLDKIGADGVAAELSERGLPASIAAHVLEDLREPAKVTDRLQSSEAGRAGLSEVDQLIEHTSGQLNAGSIVFDPFLARGLSYYTGPIFEVKHAGLGSSIASGGRYDNLIGMFAGKTIPACGGSLGMERLLMLLEDRQAASTSGPKVLVTVWDAASVGESLRIATRLRREGVSAEVYLDSDGIGGQLGYASKRGMSFAVMCGPDERAQGNVMVKDLRAKSQQALGLEEAAVWLAAAK
jgi:histidyl-tRNA synthetase